MKTVFCFGDSNTFGVDPAGGPRYSFKERWTGVLNELLGPDCIIYEDGLPGRTTVYNRPERPGENGRQALSLSLARCESIDVAVVFLGSNDLKTVYKASACDIANGLGLIASDILEYCKSSQNKVPDVFIIAPHLLTEDVFSSRFSEDFDEESLKKSRALASCCKLVCERLCIGFIDASKTIKASKEDGLHLYKEGHRQLAELVFNAITK